ncbi:hypothetical protein GCM10010168_79350 [Actinoplanes ianthinogenes]|uniref:Uncharacterized protein n=1 Tax=Actinoplanes ianthinogenes TaxID=122358 RepID=A0ABM7LK07_9ACTN|nr:hypothetical protein Aiant_02670 [Actinoplanes ianthinogenes]GGR48564.1 hypothetical protein GCM10010168_79350 [Actinoplanes ianthinogenes]
MTWLSGWVPGKAAAVKSRKACPRREQVRATRAGHGDYLANGVSGFFGSALSEGRRWDGATGVTQAGTADLAWDLLSCELPLPIALPMTSRYSWDPGGIMPNQR